MLQVQHVTGKKSTYHKSIFGEYLQYIIGFQYYMQPKMTTISKNLKQSTLPGHWYIYTYAF